MFKNSLNSKLQADAPHLCGTETPSVFEATLRPECGEDAPKFLSAVYKKGTQAQKLQAGAPQYGRSMIEMLGVLAIIGVLSIGGIAGYSKAMSKYRINKTADQVSQLAQNIRTLFASQKNYGTLNLNVIKKAHLAPEEMYESTDPDDPALTNPFGGSVSVSALGKMSYGDSKAFHIALRGIPQEACIELLTMDWGSGSSSGLIAVGSVAVSGSVLYGCQGQDGRLGYNCTGDGVMPVNKAISICQSPTDNDIWWKFY